MGVSPDGFRCQFETWSGRSGMAPTAYNAGMSFELWGQHGNLSSYGAQKVYMQSDRVFLLSVSQATMDVPRGSSTPQMVPEPDFRVDSMVPPSMTTMLEVIGDFAPSVENVKIRTPNPAFF